MAMPRERASASVARLAMRSSGRWLPGWLPSASVVAPWPIRSSRAWMASMPIRRSPWVARCSARSATMRVTAARDAANCACRAASSASWAASMSARPMSGLTARSSPGRSAEARTRVRRLSSSRCSCTWAGLRPQLAAISSTSWAGWSSIAWYTAVAPVVRPSTSSMSRPPALVGRAPVGRPGVFKQRCDGPFKIRIGAFGETWRCLRGKGPTRSGCAPHAKRRNLTWTRHGVGSSPGDWAPAGSPSGGTAERRE